MKRVRSGKPRMSLVSKRRALGFVFILPWLVGFAGFYLFNLAQTARFSVSTMIIPPEGGYFLKAVGSANFLYAFTVSAEHTRTLVESMGDMLMKLPMVLFFSLFVALLLNRKFRGRAAVRAIFFLPVIMASPAIVETLSSNLLSIMGGAGNASAMQATRAMDQSVSGLDSFALAATLLDLGAPPVLIGYIVSAVSSVYDILRMGGVQIVIFLAALQSIPPALYEVAQIEGATGYETFWKITFPMVSPMLLTNTVYTMIDQFTESPIVTLAHDTAFKTLDFGVSAAMNLINTVCVAAALLLIGGLISRKVFYQT